MEDDELKALRAKRMAELQGQGVSENLTLFENRTYLTEFCSKFFESSRTF